jgi:hypothetical protein
VSVASGNGQTGNPYPWLRLRACHWRATHSGLSWHGMGETGQARLSQPACPATKLMRFVLSDERLHVPCSQISKLTTRVRFPSPAPGVLGEIEVITSQ